MLTLLSHVTAYDVPALWLAFAGGLVTGVVTTLLVARRGWR